MLDSFRKLVVKVADSRPKSKVVTLERSAVKTHEGVASKYLEVVGYLDKNTALLLGSLTGRTKLFDLRPQIKHLFLQLLDKNGILEVHNRSRGCELDGMVNLDVFKRLFRLQTEEWESISQDHDTAINQQVNDFIRRLMIDKCPDADLRARLGGFLSRKLVATLDGAKDELRKILESERGEVLLTYDDSFVKTLDDIRKQRMFSDVAGKKAAEGDDGEEPSFSFSKMMALITGSGKVNAWPMMRLINRRSPMKWLPINTSAMRALKRCSKRARVCGPRYAAHDDCRSHPDDHSTRLGAGRRGRRGS